jgi:uncharacterized protein
VETSRSRTTVRRLSDKAVTDFEVARKILAEGLIAHVGIIDADGHPVVIPMTYAFVDDALLLHGSVASRLMRTRSEICVNVTLVDGLVVARSLFASSMNYRSVVVFGTPEILQNEEKEQALLALSDGIIPGRVGHARSPSRTEIRETTIWRLPMNEWSAKVRVGPPVEASDDDLQLPYWGGVVPLRIVAGDSESDGQGQQVVVPQHIADFVKKFQ